MHSFCAVVERTDIEHILYHEKVTCLNNPKLCFVQYRPFSKSVCAYTATFLEQFEHIIYVIFILHCRGNRARLNSATMV